MGDWYVAAAVGAGLVLIGLAMIRGHLRSWQKQKSDESIDELDQRHFYARFQRRIQTSGLIVLLGILIPIGDLPLMWRQGPLVSACFWIAVLFIPVWIILLAMGDWSSTKAHSKTALARVQQQQRKLEAQLSQIRSRRSNGRRQVE